MKFIVTTWLSSSMFNEEHWEIDVMGRFLDFSFSTPPGLVFVSLLSLYIILKNKEGEKRDKKKRVDKTLKE